tara:strand:- start:8598 stop:8987 length:390 start_codon:yes stop_codon:yes gene_type:complete
MFEYTIKVTRVVDGDTVDAEIDLGFDVRVKKRIRLFGINTPESRTRDKEEKKRGLAAKYRLEEIIDQSEVIRLRSHGSGKYGRVLGELMITDDHSSDTADLYEDGEWISIATILINESHGVPYFGGKRK